MSGRHLLSLLEGVELIGTGNVGSALLGFAFALYSFCARLLYQQLNDPQRRRQNAVTLTHMSLVMAFALADAAIGSRIAQLSYNEHRNYPGGPLVYQAVIADRLPIAVAAASISFALECFTVGIQIWRLWIIWNMSRFATFVAILPILFLLSYMGTQIAVAVIISHPGSSEHALSFLNPASEALNLLATLTVTFLIIARIVLVHRRNKVICQCESARQYTTVVTMLIESFALDSVWTLATLSSLRSMAKKF